MRKSITRFSLIVAVTCVCSGVIAQTHVGKWNTTNAFTHKKGTERVKVQVTSRENEYIAVTYKLPEVACKTIQSRGAVREMEQVILSGAPTTALEGEPRLPVIPVKVIIPQGYIIDIEKIKVSRNNKYVLPGEHYIAYGEATFPLVPGVKPRRAQPKSAIYNSDQPFPGKAYDFIGIQKKHGVSIAFINLHPITYYPKSGQVYSYNNIACLLPLKLAASPKKIKGSVFPKRFNHFTIGVDNPNALYKYETVQPKIRRRSRGICDPADSYRYVLVTSEAIRDAATDYTVHDLIAQKEARGLTATIVTIEDVYGNYSGVDDAEKLRNFIIDAYNNWETEFVLLGGDINIIPLRYLYAEGTTIPSDLYYQCLDGDYNSDGDGYWGEPTDGPGGTDVDLMAEVYIGRASAENPTEMSHFVYKTLAYENDAAGSPYLRQALITGEYLGSQFGPGEFSYARPYMDEIRFGSSASGYTTVGFSACPSFSVDTLYDYDGTWSKSHITDIINGNNYSIINHLGHANTDYVMKFYNADADALTNTSFLFAYSQGCIPGDFSADCIAEHLTTSNRHGMYAVVFNSRYGWGAYNDSRATMDGPSQRFDRQFWDAYFGEYIFNLGAINADSHEDNIWDINGTHIRWCFYESNLLGDPQTPLRGQVTGPSLAYSSHTFSDSAGGNNDKLINPGEQIIMRTTLVNVGSEVATGVTADITTTDAYVTIQDNTAAFGDIPGAGATGEALDDYIITINAGCPTPHTVTFDLAIQDDDTGSWTSGFTIDVYTSSQVEGYVTTFTGSNPVQNATVEYSGPLSGSVQTDAGGYYMFGVIDGAYDVFVRHNDYLPSDTQSVTVPPNQTNVNFTLKRPQISVTPLAISDTVLVGDSTTANATVENNGDAPLHFTITSVDNTVSQVVPVEQLYDSTHFITIPKGQKDTRIGKPVALGKGGPDNFGYSWKDSDEPGGPQYVWNDISSTGTLLTTASSCDDCYQQQTIPFSFPFYENEFTSIFVSSNGYITFGSGSSQYSNYPLPSTSMPPNLIAGFFDDLTTLGVGDIYYQDFGNKVIVQFDNVPRLAGDATLTYQIVLEESGAIYLYFENVTGNLSNATIGIQNVTRDDGLEVAYNASYLKNSLAVQFRFTPDWLRPTPASGTINPGGTVPVSVTLDASELLGGSYYGALSFNHNDPVAVNPYVLPCTLYVDGIRRLAVSPDVYDFGNVWVGTYDTAAFILTNAGDEPVTVNGIASNNPVFIHATSLPIIVPPFSTQTLEIVCHPSTIGTENGIITINSDAEDNPILTVGLSGTGTPPPEIAVAPDHFHETLDGGDSTTQALTIHNPGGDNLSFEIGISNISQQSPIYGNNYSGTINVLWDLTHGVTSDYTPAGAYSGLALLLDSLQFEIDTIRDSVINVNLALYDILFISLGSAWNTVYSPGEVSAIESFVTGGGGLLILSDNSACPNANINPVTEIFGTTCGLSHSISTITDLEPHSIFDSTTAIYFAAGGELQALSPSVVVARDISGYNAITIAEYGAGTAIMLGDLNFWTNSYISNDDNYVLARNVFTWLAGGTTRWIKVNPVTGDVLPGSSLGVDVSFNAENLINGDYLCDLTVLHNAPSTPNHISIPCTLTVNGFRSLAVFPQSFDFNSVWVGVSDSAAVTLTNDGNEATTVSALTSNNAEFIHDATGPFTVQPFESVTFNAIFAPVDMGSESGIITITSDAEDNPTLTVNLTGTGTTPPEIAVTPGYFHETLDAGDSVTDTLHISNTGGDDLEFSIRAVSQTTFLTGTIDILTWTPYGDMGGEYLNTLNAIGQYTSDYTIDTSITFDPVTLATELVDKEVFLVVEQEGGTIPSGTGTAFSSELDSFLMRGGIIIYLCPGWSGNTTLFLSEAGLLDLTYLGQNSSSSLLLLEPNHPLFQGVVEPLYTQNATSYCTVNDSSTILAAYNGNMVIAEKQIHSGRVITLGPDFFEYTDNWAHIISNAVQMGPAQPVWLSVEIESGVVPVGQTMDVPVKMTSEGLPGGMYSGILEIMHNVPGQSEIAVPCTLSVNGFKRLSVTPQSFDFGNLWAGLRDSTIITLTNNGNGATAVSDISIDNAEFIHDAPLPLTVPPFESVTFNAVFAPVDVGSESGTITITSDAEDNPVLTVSLSGNGTEPPEIAVSPESLSELVDPGDSVTRSITISNNGADDLIFSAKAKEGEVSSIIRNPRLIPGPGNTNNNEQGNDCVTLGQKSEIHSKPDLYPEFAPAASDLSILFATTSLGQSNDFVTGLRGLTNVSTVDELNCGSSTPNVDYMLNYDIVVAASNSSWADAALMGNNLADYVDAGGKVVLLCAVNCSGGGWTLQGRIMEPQYSPLADTTYAVSSISSASFADHPITEGVTSITSGLYAYARTLQGSGQPVGLFTDGFLIGAYNTENAVVVVNTFTQDTYWGGDLILMMGNIFDWFISNEWLTVDPGDTTITLPPGENIDLLVTMNSVGLISDIYEGRIEINHNDPSSPDTLLVPCTLTVNGLRRLTVFPGSYDFGDLWTGLSDSATITLTNTGNEATTVSSITSDNAEFTHNAVLPLTVPAFDTLTFEAIFSPVDTGSKSGLLTINSDAADNPVLTVDVYGRGTAPPQIAVSPQGFTKRLPEGGVTFDILIVNNTGGDALSYAISDSTGYWPIWLQPSHTSGIVLPAEFDTIDFTFDATTLSEGTYNALLIVTHNVPGTNPVEIPVILYVGDAVAGVSRIRYIGPAASTSARGTIYTMEEILVGSPTSGNTKGNKYQLKLK